MTAEPSSVPSTLPSGLPSTLPSGLLSTDSRSSEPRLSRRLLRRVARVGAVVIAGLSFVPMTAASSSGAGTTAVAAATNDPIAVAAATALDLLRGGSGTPIVRSPGTIVDSVPATPASTVPQPVTENTTPTWQPVTTAATSRSMDTPERFANAAPVSMLPAPTDVTVPTVVTTAPATIVTMTTKKATSKKTATTSVVAVPVEGVAPVVGASGYDAVRRALATLVAGRLQKVSAENLDLAWSNADPRRMMAVYAALAQVGTNYRYSGNEPGGFDCSGLTSYAWSVAGVKIPRTSTDQILAASPRSPEALLPGDLVWRPGHVMMYLGTGEFIIDSPQTGKQVTVRQWGRTSRYGSPI